MQEDLQRLKQMLEAQGRETGAWRGEVHGGRVNAASRNPASGAAGLGGQSEDALLKDKGGPDADGRLNAGKEVDVDQQSDAERGAGDLRRQSTEGYGDMGNK